MFNYYVCLNADPFACANIFDLLLSIISEDGDVPKYNMVLFFGEFDQFDFSFWITDLSLRKWRDIICIQYNSFSLS